MNYDYAGTVYWWFIFHPLYCPTKFQTGKRVYLFIFIESSSVLPFVFTPINKGTHGGIIPSILWKEKITVVRKFWMMSMMMCKPSLKLTASWCTCKNILVIATATATMKTKVNKKNKCLLRHAPSCISSLTDLRSWFFKHGQLLTFCYCRILVSKVDIRPSIWREGEVDYIDPSF